jgi:hypothetical protein
VVTICLSEVWVGCIMVGVAVKPVVEAIRLSRAERSTKWFRKNSNGVCAMDGTIVVVRRCTDYNLLFSQGSRLAAYPYNSSHFVRVVDVVDHS